MNTQEHLEKIKAKCQQLLEIAEKRTHGKWEQDHIYVDTDDNNDLIKAAGNGNNAAFIASCAGAGWRSTIMAIVESQDHQYIGEPESDYFERQPLIIKQIINAWPIELL